MPLVLGGLYTLHRQIFVKTIILDTAQNKNFNLINLQDYSIYLNVQRR